MKPRLTEEPQPPEGQKAGGPACLQRPSPQTPKATSGDHRGTHRDDGTRAQDDSGQAGFFPVARARNSWRNRDPEPSFEAARKQTPERINSVQRCVLSVLQLADEPLTDEEIIEELKRAFPGRRIADSTARTRRKELVVKGLVSAVKGVYGTTKAGSRCTLWEVSDAS